MRSYGNYPELSFLCKIFDTNTEDHSIFLIGYGNCYATCDIKKIDEENHAD